MTCMIWNTRLLCFWCLREGKGGSKKVKSISSADGQFFLIFQPEKQFKSSGFFHQQLQDSLFWFSPQRQLYNCKSNCGHLSNGVHHRRHFHTCIQTLQRRWQTLRWPAFRKMTCTISYFLKIPWSSQPSIKNSHLFKRSIDFTSGMIAYQLVSKLGDQSTSWPMGTLICQCSLPNTFAAPSGVVEMILTVLSHYISTMWFCWGWRDTEWWLLARKVLVNHTF